MDAKQQKAARLAAALRANLKKRKELRREPVVPDESEEGLRNPRDPL